MCHTRCGVSCARRVFETTIDKAFSEVIVACAKREDTWINREIIESYTRLHALGHAHSVEAWKAGRLAGGPLRRRSGWSFLWGIDVSSRD